MFCELEHLLKTHSDHEVLSDQSSLRDVVAVLRQVANELGLDFQSALVRAEVERESFSTLASFDPCI